MHFFCIVLCALLFGLPSFGAPLKSVQVLGNVSSLAHTKKLLYASTDVGVVEIFSKQDLKKVDEIKLPLITNFLDESYTPKIIMSDSLDDRQVLILAEGSNNTKDLLLWDSKTLKKILQEQSNLNIAEAYFLDNTKILLALMSNEILLYDLANKNFMYRKQISTAPFSSLSLSKDRKTFALSCESGIIYYFDSLSGNLLKKFDSIHKDNVYQVALGDSYILSAGRDKRVGVVSLKTNTQRFIQTDFLVYSVGVGEQVGAYMQNEQSDIAVFSLATLQEIKTLKGHHNLINSLIFINDRLLISSSDSPNIFLWEINNEQ